MSQLGSIPASGMAGHAKPTLANVLSARFPVIRRMIARELNLHDRGSLCLTSCGLNVSINSQDHLNHFAQYFSGQCECKLPSQEAERCVYGVDFKDAELKSCDHDTSRRVLRLCEGPEVLKNAQCHGVGRTVCSWCATEVCEIADPGSFQNRIPNFGVTPLCDSCANISKTANDVVDCVCIGPPLKDGERKDEELNLCLECRIAYNIERFQFADDMARSYLFIKTNSHGTLEYLPEVGTKYMKLPTCPCGNARHWSKCNFDLIRGMCVWCGGLKMPSFESIEFKAREFWDIWYIENIKQLYLHIKGQAIPTNAAEHQVIEPERFATLQLQIEQKGLPAPIPRGTNKYSSYAGVNDELRILDPNLRRQYERSRRKRPNCLSDRKSLKWDDREGFLRLFRWPCIDSREYSVGRWTIEAARRYREARDDRVDHHKGWRGTVRDRTLPRTDDESKYTEYVEDLEYLLVRYNHEEWRRVPGYVDRWLQAQENESAE
jgi:hypothetical protein